MRLEITTERYGKTTLNYVVYIFKQFADLLSNKLNLNVKPYNLYVDHPGWEVKGTNNAVEYRVQFAVKKWFSKRLLGECILDFADLDGKGYLPKYITYNVHDKSVNEIIKSVAEEIIRNNPDLKKTKLSVRI